jgi:uncharacterized integral membrane protein (TIGR00698 family)
MATYIETKPSIQFERVRSAFNHLQTHVSGHSRTIFFVAVILSASELVSPPVALAAGLLYGLTLTHPYPAESKRLAKFLLQASVVLLGFGMNLAQVMRAGGAGFLFTAIGISVTLALGWISGRLLRVPQRQSFLISAGTAICGGSAIAALGPVVSASEEEMAISLGTVFVLNSIALIVFPLIGSALHLTQTQFGLWAALAIHDTSSVVGASAKYGTLALAVGTTVKLARALWIVPLSLTTAAINRRRNANPSQDAGPIPWPWFILFFVVAAIFKTYAPAFSNVYPELSQLGKAGLIVTLFLIGAGINRQLFVRVGARPLIQGIVLWVNVALASLAAILKGRVHL